MSEENKSGQSTQASGERSPKKDKTLHDARHNIYEFIDSQSLEISLGRVSGVQRIVTMTSEMLMKVILTRTHWSTPALLLKEVRRCGDIIQRRNPLQFEINNTVLRVMRFIRRAAEAICAAQQQRPDTDPSPVSLAMSESTAYTPSPRVSPSEGALAMSSAGEDIRSTLSASRVLNDQDRGEKPYMLKTFDKNMRSQLREIVQTNILDFIENEVEVALDEMGSLAREQVHPNECILVYGYSSAVLRFLTVAKQHSVKFEVLVTESSPREDGQDMAVELVKAGITTTLVPDSALFVMMPRVSKVIIGAHAIMSNGGVLSASGTHLVALVARKHGVPLMVCSSLVKLTPRYPYDLEELSCLSNPAEILSHDMLQRPDSVGVLNPRFDYIPPELVSLFATDHGCHTPSFIYRLLEEYYDSEDYQFNPMK